MWVYIENNNVKYKIRFVEAYTNQKNTYILRRKLLFNNAQ